MSNVWSVSAHCILGCSVLSVVWVVVYRLQNIWSTYPVYYFFYFCLCYEAVVINILISSMPYSVFISSILHLNSILYRNVKTQVRKKINNHTRHHFLFICHSRNRRSGHSTLLQYSDHSVVCGGVNGWNGCVRATLRQAVHRLVPADEQSPLVMLTLASSTQIKCLIFIAGCKAIDLSLLINLFN